jgi:hypothetical protein
MNAYTNKESGMTNIPPMPHGCNSWVIISKQTGKAICELFNIDNVMKVDATKNIILDAKTYLSGLNK